MRRALKQSGAVFGQEIARSNRWRRGNYSAMWQRVASVFDKRTVGDPHEIPVSLPEAWAFLGYEVVKVHDGLRKVSPARYITVARALVGGRMIAFVNCHPVSKPRRHVSASAWRIARWNEYHDRLSAIVADLHDRDYTVIFGGDMNKRDVPRVHPAQGVAISSGLDHLWYVPAQGVSVTVTHRSKVGRTVLMDHPILTANLDLS
jgi:hypothetical protein